MIGDTLIKALKNYKKITEEHKKFYGDKYLKHYEKKVLNEYTKREASVSDIENGL